MVCCGNDVGASTLVTLLSNVEVRVEINRLAVQIITLSSCSAELLCRWVCLVQWKCSHRDLTGWYTLWRSMLQSGQASLCSERCGVICKRHFEIWYDCPKRRDWDASVEIGLELHFNHFCCPDFLKFIWIQSGYAKKWIWASTLNKAADALTIQALRSQYLHTAQHLPLYSV